MRHNKISEAIQQGKRAFDRLASEAKDKCHTHTTILDEKLRISTILRDTYPKLPRWAWAELSGYWSRIHREFEQATTFGYVYQGQLYVVHYARIPGAKTTNDLANLIGWREVGKCPGGTFWDHTVLADPKPFSEVKVM